MVGRVCHPDIERSLVRALLLSCVATLIAAPSTRAQDTPPVAWDATTALVVAPKSRASATLRNDTARDLSVSFQISGKFTVNRPEVELTPAEVATIRVTSTDGKTGTATLAAVVKPSEELPLGYVARRDVTIGGAPSAAVEPTAKVRSTWGGGGATKGNLIPLTASDCAKVAVPQTPAGHVLSDDGRRAAVTLACLAARHARRARDVVRRAREHRREVHRRRRGRDWHGCGHCRSHDDVADPGRPAARGPVHGPVVARARPEAGGQRAEGPAAPRPGGDRQP